MQAEVTLRQGVLKKLGIPEDDIKKFVEDNVFAVNEKLEDFEKISKVIIRDKDFDRTPAMKIIRPKKVFWDDKIGNSK